MAQFTIADLVEAGARLGIRHRAGPALGHPVERVEAVALDRIDDAAAGSLVIATAEEPPPPFRIDIAVRRASARGVAGLVFAFDLALSETAAALARRADLAVFDAPATTPGELVVAVDRAIAGGLSEAMMRAAAAVARAGEAAAVPAATPESILAAAGRALGATLRIAPDAAAAWTDADAVCIGEVPIGRLVAEPADPASAAAVPVIASLASRAAQRRMTDRFAPLQSRADLLVELVLAEPARVEGFVAPAARLGLPLQLSHAAAWMSASSPADPTARAPRSLQPALELAALQSVEGRPELWHVAFLQDDLLVVVTEEHGAGDHQRRLREVAERIQTRAHELAGPGWAYTVGLGTPQTGAMGLRQSAAEARIAAESAVAAGRTGGVELTDVTGLRRVLLDVYASAISRSLLDDVLRPLDEAGPDRAMTAVRTLLSYLAHRNSLVHAGRELTLHPNAVAYRLKRIRQALQLDLDDPDTRFALELACRVRLLGAGRR